MSDDFVSVSSTTEGSEGQSSSDSSSQEKPEKTSLEDLPSALISAYELQDIMGQRYLIQRFGDPHRGGPNAAIDRLTLVARQIPPGAWVLVLAGPLDIDVPDQETDEDMQPPYQDPRPDPDIKPETIKKIQEENQQLADEDATPEELTEKGKEQNKTLQQEANPPEKE